MARITITTSAVDKLINDPKFRQWQHEGSARRVPFLGYFRRSYTTSHDGTVNEHGDGFMLTTIDPTNENETKDIVLRSVEVTDGRDILVGGDASIMLEDFVIGWSKWKYTREAEATQSGSDD